LAVTSHVPPLRTNCDIFFSPSISNPDPLPSPPSVSKNHNYFHYATTPNAFSRFLPFFPGDSSLGSFSERQAFHHRSAIRTENFTFLLSPPSQVFFFLSPAPQNPPSLHQGRFRLFSEKLVFLCAIFFKHPLRLAQLVRFYPLSSPDGTEFSFSPSELLMIPLRSVCACVIAAELSVPLNSIYFPVFPLSFFLG